MCGIAGYSGKGDAWDVISSLLREMEYRGYDSCGVALGRPDIVEKTVGTVDRLKPVRGFTVGIGHTRWATHGKVSKANAHPHLSCDGRIAIVHNGIISNHSALRQWLMERGHVFRSETDSEVIAHLIEECGIWKAMEMLEGDYAVAGIMDGKLFAMKHGSPLVVGFSGNDVFIASDPLSLSGFAERVVVMDDGDVLVDGRLMRNGKGAEKEAISVSAFDPGREKRMEHYMIQEIHEQPRVAMAVMKSGEWRKLVPEEMLLIASGSSYNASLFYSSLLNLSGIDARAVIASEAGLVKNLGIGKVVAVSQSGETADVITAVKSIERQFDAIVNVPYSTLDRMARRSIYMMAGRERAVAATKTFIAEISLFSLSWSLVSGESVDVVTPVERALSMEDEARAVGREISNAGSMYVLGRHENYAIAREIALKIKEIAYVHAESHESGEMKHGPLALVDEGFPAIIVVSSERDLHAAEELASRGAKVFILQPSGTDAGRDSGFTSIASGMDGVEHSIFSAVIGQMVAYYAARALGLPIDRPRNLAKSVTVL